MDLSTASKEGAGFCFFFGSVASLTVSTALGFAVSFDFSTAAFVFGFSDASAFAFGVFSDLVVDFFTVVATVGFGSARENGGPVRLVKNTTTLTPGQTGTYTVNDGKTYNTICIGTQEWMSEDLRETKYRGLSVIPNVTTQSTWNGLTTGAYCIYNNDPLNVNGCPQTNCLPITKINIPFFYAYSIQPSGQPSGPPIDFTSSEISACNGINAAVNVVSPNTSAIYSLSRSVQSLSVGSRVYDGLNPNPITTCSPYLTTMNGYFCTNVTTKEITHVVNGIIQSITYCP
jgi:hypothetical protein